MVTCVDVLKFIFALLQQCIINQSKLWKREVLQLHHLSAYCNSLCIDYIFTVNFKSVVGLKVTRSHLTQD